MTKVRKTMLVSQIPLNVVGGGELFTIRSFAQLTNESPDSELWCAETVQPTIAGFDDRMQQAFVKVRLEGETVHFEERRSLRDLLYTIPSFETVAVHQYLSAASTIDFLAATAPDQQSVLTSLGHEPFLPFFKRVFEPASNVHLIEISQFAAERSRSRGYDSITVATGAFESGIRQVQRPTSGPSHREHFKAVALGRLLPHKGFEVTAAAIPESWKLEIIGPPSGDGDYESLLRQIAEASQEISIVGYLDHQQRDAKLTAADVLVASSTQTLYDGRHLEQAELFGLVLLESVAAGILPIASDLPSFREIMGNLGLERFIYPERDVDELRRQLLQFEQLTEEVRQSYIENAQEMLREKYLWEDYWHRIESYLPPASPPRSSLGLQSKRMVA